MTTMYEALPGAPGHDELLAWVAEHGLDPVQLKRQFFVENDGTVVLSRWLYNAAGEKYIEPGTDEIATEHVRVTPTRPLPAGALAVLA